MLQPLYASETMLYVINPVPVEKKLRTVTPHDMGEKDIMEIVKRDTR